MTLDVPATLAPMEARLASALPTEPGWWFEPKWDGFRCLAFKDAAAVSLVSKSGKPLTRYFPEVAAAIGQLPQASLVLDGELTVAVAGRVAFDALQARLHPAASRIAKLAVETPADFVVFDCLADTEGRSILEQPFALRRRRLVDLATSWQPGLRLSLSPGSEDIGRAEAWLAQAGAALDGVIAKRLEAPYASGQREMLKVKPVRTADCVVGGFRRGKDRPLVASLLLGLYDAAGLLNHVGFTAMISDAERPALTRRLEALVAAPGFTGKAPGGPSRWTTDRTVRWEPLRPELVVEVGYDQVTGQRLRHGARLLRWRPDKAPHQCRMDQLEAEIAPTAFIGAAGLPPASR